MIGWFGNSQKKRSLFFAALLCTSFSCQKKNPVSNNNPAEEPKTPSLSIITPSVDTTVALTADSVALIAVVENSDYVDSVKVNGQKLALLSFDNDTLRLKMKIDTDTSKFMVTVYYQQNKSLKDSILVFRSTPQLNGLAKISGTLLQESNSPLAKKLGKKRTALNAQGTSVEVDKVIPVSGADVMVYDAEALSTSSDTTVQTDSTGKWTVELEPGTYFVFAVYFDREKLEIVTTALPDIQAEKDKETVTDSAIAVTDDINPMLMTFLDAAEANDQQFIGSDVPKGLPIVMSFSEPMTRASIGDSTHGIVLGLVDVDSSDLPLLDTIPVKKLWGPDGKELRMVPSKDLTVGATYKVAVTSSVKDLALNKLDNDYSGIFTVSEAASLPPFALKNTSPTNGDTIPSGFPVECIFTRPLDGLSLNKQFSITSTSDSLVSGFFEVKGNVARFVNKAPWIPNASYSLKIRSGAKDLLGDSLGSETSLTFVIKPKDSFEQKEGIEGIVASSVKHFMGAYISGDIETFSQSFHASFELIETSPDGKENRLQLITFLDQMRAEIEQRNRMSKFGIIAPVFYYPEVNGKRYVAWKLIKGSLSLYFEDIGPEGGIGKIPTVLTMDKIDITDSVKYVSRGIVYQGETLYVAPDMSKSFIDENSRENDPTIFGKLLKSGTNVETQEIMMELRNDFVVRNLSAQTGNDTAQVMIELITEEKYLNGKRPFPVMDPQNPPPDIEKRVTALQTKMVLASGKWMVLQIVAKELYSGNKDAFSQDAIKDTSFVIKNFEQTRPIEFVSPKHKAVSVAVPTTFEWSVPKEDGIGGYIVAIADELSGGQQGLLIFTRNNKFTLSDKGAIDNGATILSVDPKSLTIPIPRFSSRLTSFSLNDSAVYVWKVIAIKDTLASAITAGGMPVIIADSDFGSQRGIGIFTHMASMPDIALTLNQVNPEMNQPDNRFSDKDGDMFPDWIERAFATSPDDPGSYPNFTLDTDLDGYPDFMETFAGSSPDDAASKPEDKAPADNIPDKFQTRPDWKPELNMDDDKDGFPNEVEMIFGTDPWNADSKPSKSIKASVPVNSYFGGLRLGEQGWQRINFALISDTIGNFAIIDTTELQGIARGGVDLTVKLIWSNGEWAFFIGLVNGPNTGKFIKVRFHQEGNNLRGPVDLADMENGGGPYIGEFFASTDSIKDFASMGSTPAGPVINQPQQGPVNLGPPPMDRLKRPGSSSTDLTVELHFSDNGELTSVTSTINSAAVTFERPFWAPGQFPSLGCNAPNTPEQYRLEGNLHRLTGSSVDKDTLVLIGIIEFNKQNEGGGTFRQKFDYTLLLAGAADPKKPSGSWSGWYTEPVGPVNQTSNPFIGKRDTVDAALSRCENKGFVMGTNNIVSITTTMQEGNIWVAKADTVTYFIMEQMGNFESVMLKTIDGKMYIGLTPKNSGMIPGPGPTGGMLFNGDSTKIAAALSASSNNVKVAAPNPFVLSVDPASLHRETPGTAAEIQWVVSEQGKPEHKLIFLAADNDKAALRIEENNPVVQEMMNGPNPINRMVFSGDSVIITTALAESNNHVVLEGPNANQVEINPASLHKILNPEKPEESGFVVAAAANEADLFVFMGNAENPQQLLKSGNAPVVFKK